MMVLRRLLMRLVSTITGRRQIERLKEEIEGHLELQTADNLRAGMPPEEARRRALLKFGPVEAISEDWLDRQGLPLIEHLGRDGRFALRQLRRNPGFAFAAILVLALGICASVSIFAFVDAALIRPLPYRDPTRLVGVYESIPLCPLCNLSYPDYLDWKRLNSVFTSLDVYQAGGFTLNTAEGAERTGGARVTAGFFRTLGIVPVIGRDFQAGEDQPASPRAVLLSYAAWQKRYGGSSNVLGQAVTLDGEPNVIIGVLPPGFHFAPAEEAEFWAALHATGGCFERRSCHSLYGIARLRDGVSVQAALTNVKAIAQRLEKVYPDSNRGQRANVIGLTEVVVGEIRPILLVLLSGAGLLLLIASVNIASLLLLRTESRKREIAVRTALGGSAARLFSQFATEALVLTAAGAILGVCLAGWGMVLLIRLIPEPMSAGMPYLNNLGFNAHVLGFAGAVSLLAAVLFSIAPAFCLARLEVREALSEGTRGSAGTAWRRFGTKLVVVELATAVILMVGAGLIGRSLHRLLQVDLGFVPAHLATLRVSVPRTRYPKDRQIVALQQRLLSQMTNLPGVESTGITSRLPLLTGNTMWIKIVGRPYNGEHNEVSYREVSAGYFRTLQAKLISGRFFREEEDGTKPPVLIISRSLAKKYFPGEDPIGKQMLYASFSTPPMEIIGVVEDIKEGAADKENWPALYAPFNQDPTSSFSLVVRSSQAAQSLLTTIAASVHRVDPGISVYDGRTMLQRIQDSPGTYLRRSSAWLVGAFAVIALLLSAVGLYGVVAYSVARRTREIGIRMALGAQRREVCRLVLKEAAGLIAFGAATGLACSVAAAKLMGGLLFGVYPWDAPTLGGAAAVLVISALLASFLPARRASSVNPVEALRAE